MTLKTERFTDIGSFDLRLIEYSWPLIEKNMIWPDKFNTIESKKKFIENRCEFMLKHPNSFCCKTVLDETEDVKAGFGILQNEYFIYYSFFSKEINNSRSWLYDEETITEFWSFLKSEGVKGMLMLTSDETSRVHNYINSSYKKRSDCIVEDNYILNEIKYTKLDFL